MPATHPDKGAQCHQRHQLDNKEEDLEPASLNGGHIAINEGGENSRVEDGWQEVADNGDAPADQKVVSGPVVAIILEKVGAYK